MKVEICELRPEVVAESDEVLVHYQSRTNVQRGLFRGLVKTRADYACSGSEGEVTLRTSTTTQEGL